MYFKYMEFGYKTKWQSMVSSLDGNTAAVSEWIYVHGKADTLL
jgi:hypothetical protein